LQKSIVAFLTQAVNSQHQWTDLARDIVDQLFNFFYRYPHAARLDSYRLLEATAPHTTVQQSQALLLSVSEQLRGLLLSPSASTTDVALIILSVNVLVREYFTSPEFFRQLLGEQSQETTENCFKHHVQRSIERLLQLLANRG
jgi:hypothetical protein